MLMSRAPKAFASAGRRPLVFSSCLPRFRFSVSASRTRRLDKDYVIEQRLQIAFNEIKQYKNYDFLIINEELGRSIEELQSIVVSSRCRMSHRAQSARSIVATFGGLDAEDP